jgi:hypothetical protein
MIFFSAGKKTHHDAVAQKRNVGKDLRRTYALIKTGTPFALYRTESDYYSHKAIRISRTSLRFLKDRIHLLQSSRLLRIHFMAPIREITSQMVDITCKLHNGIWLLFIKNQLAKLIRAKPARD